MRGRRVVIGASAVAVLGLVSVAHGHSTTTRREATADVIACKRDNEGYVRVAGTLQNLADSNRRVEVTVGVFDASTGKQLDYTQAKSGSLAPGQSERYIAAVYTLKGEISIPYATTIQCRVTNVQALDPSEVG
jgi:hypothetical protein